MQEGVFAEVNNDLVPYKPPFTAEAESTATKGLRAFDYTFAGIFGFTLLSLGIFGPTTVFPRLKQRGVLRSFDGLPAMDEVTRQIEAVLNGG